MNNTKPKPDTDPTEMSALALLFAAERYAEDEARQNAAKNAEERAPIVKECNESVIALVRAALAFAAQRLTDDETAIGPQGREWWQK